MVFDWRIFWSVFAALVAWSAFMALMAFFWTLLVTVSLEHEAKQAAAHAVALVSHKRHQHQQAVQRDRDRRRLSPTQRCVGGTVLDVHGSTFVQHLDRYLHPVPCKGHYASRPLR